MPSKFQFPENCYQKLKQSDDIFDRMAAAFVVLRIKNTEPVPQEEIESAFSTMTDYHLSMMKKEEM